MAGLGSCSCAVCAGGTDLQYAGDASQALSSSGKPEWSLDQVLANLMRWDARWEAPLSIPFSFYDTRPAHLADSSSYQGFVAFDAAQRAATRTVLDVIADVAGVKFVEVADDGADPGAAIPRLTYARADWGHAWATAVANVDMSPGLALGDAREIHAAEISFNTQRWAGEALPSGREFYVLLHETMHALGFPHPGQYNRNANEEITFAQHAEYSQDSVQYTVLSYFGAGATGGDFKGAFASTLMLHDIAALQAVYGANTTTRTGDTVYGFESTAGRSVYDFAVNNRPVVSIWDAGGIDTINLSGFAQAARLDLNPGAFSDVAGMIGNLSVAFGAVIENAIAGAFADVITGNGAANQILGGPGDDRIEGRGGDDVLFGNQGADTLDGGDGNDRLFGGRDNDRLQGGAGADALTGDLGDDVILGEAGLDILSGGDGADRLDGGADRDLLFGGFGNDTLEGGLGDDFVAGDQGDDVITNLGGVDFLMGLDGDDTVSAGADGDLLLGNQGRDLLTGGAGADTLFGGRDSDTLSGGGGDDRISGDLGADVLTGGAGSDLFVFNALADSAPGAADRITDFLSGTDRIDLSAIDANSSTAADEAFVLVSQFSNQAGQLVLSYDAGANATTLRLDVNGDGVSDFDLLINGQVGAGDGWVL